MKHRSDPECILQRSHFILAFFRATRNWFHKGAGGVGHSRPLVTERVSIRAIKSEANPTNGNSFSPQKIIHGPQCGKTFNLVYLKLNSENKIICEFDVPAPAFNLWCDLEQLRDEIQKKFSVK